MPTIATGTVVALYRTQVHGPFEEKGTLDYLGVHIEYRTHLPHMTGSNILHDAKNSYDSFFGSSVIQRYLFSYVALLTSVSVKCFNYEHSTGTKSRLLNRVLKIFT